MDENKVTLSVNGVDFSWWTSASITCELVNITRQFNVSFTQDLSGTTANPFEGLPRVGDAVTFKIGNDVVATGYVTTSSSSYSATGVNLSIAGASKTIDLVECTMPLESAHRFSGVTVRDVVAALAAPYGISVVDEVSATEKTTLDVTPTKKIKSALEEVSKQHSLILTDNAKGDLVITKAGAGGNTTDALKLGENVLTGSRTVNGSQVYSCYTVVGQSANSDSNLSVTANQTKATATVEGYRPREFVYLQSGDARQSAMQARAQLLRNHALGASETFTYTVQGWRQSNGELWRPNTLVRVVDSIFGVDQVLLIDQVTLTKGDGGTTATLRCIHPEALLDTDEKELPKKAKATSNSSLGLNAKGKTEEANWSKS